LNWVITLRPNQTPDTPSLSGSSKLNSSWTPFLCL